MWNFLQGFFNPITRAVKLQVSFKKQADAALSGFRKTADNLDSIVEKLKEHTTFIDEQITTLNTAKDNTAQQIADNTTVRDKILDFLDSSVKAKK